MSDQGILRPAGAIDVVEEDGVPVLWLRGEIDSLTVCRFDRRAVAPGRVAAAPSVIDASAVTFLDGRGLRFLLRQTRAARRAGTQPVLRRPARVVRRVIDVAGAEGLFTIAA